MTALLYAFNKEKTLEALPLSIVKATVKLFDTFSAWILGTDRYGSFSKWVFSLRPQRSDLQVYQSPNNPSNLRLYFNHFSVRVRKRIIHESTTFACNVSGWRRAGRGWTPSAARPRRTGATTRPRPTLARPPPPTVGHQPQLLSSYPSNLYSLEL